MKLHYLLQKCSFFLDYIGRFFGQRRRFYENWLTAKDNQLFRRNLANRLWAHFFGRGIVEPVDDIRISNPPSNEELLEELGKVRRKWSPGYAALGLAMMGSVEARDAIHARLEKTSHRESRRAWLGRLLAETCYMSKPSPCQNNAP